MDWRRFSNKLRDRDSEDAKCQSPQHIPRGKSNTSSDSSDDDEEDFGKVAPIHVDIFGAAVSSLIRDSNVLAKGESSGRNSIRAFRVICSMGGCWLHMALQSYLVYMSGIVISDLVVRDFRKEYDAYEVHMYGNHSNATYLTETGFHRGNEQYFDPKRFITFDSSLQSTICQMPLANDLFFCAVIFIWTLTCLVDMRKCFQMFHSFVIAMPTVPSIEHSVKMIPQSHDENEVIIVGIPLHFKTVMIIVLFLPRFFVDCALCWYGCRWLAATDQLGDLMLNALAMEFVVLLNELILVALVPKHGLDGLERTKTLVGSSRFSTAELAVGATFAWVLVSIIWCVSYVYLLQDVLPEYSWDIRDVCTVWRKFHHTDEGAE